MTVTHPIRRGVSEGTRNELRVAVECLNAEWRQQETEALAIHIRHFFGDWRPDLSAVGLRCMWLRYQQHGDVEALLDELTKAVA
jgi:hypothetical protein